MLQPLAPIHDLWWTIFGIPIGAALTFVYGLIHDVPILDDIGAYGIAILTVTLIIKLILSPLYEFQIRAGRRTMLQQRRLAPELRALKQRHKGNSQELQAATMRLYKERGINPLGNMTGCIPSLVQLPIIYALYWVFRDIPKMHPGWNDHFLFVPHLNQAPVQHPIFHGLPIPDLTYLAIPLLAGLTTLVQSRMMQQPPNPSATEQERSQQQMMKSMTMIMPLMIIVFATQVAAGLGLYWFMSNCVAIAQQYRVNGWGGLRPKEQLARLTAEVDAEPQPPPRGIPAKRSSVSPSEAVRAGAPAARPAPAPAPPPAARRPKSAKRRRAKRRR